jgi:phenylalanyl-tRNA synthetase beta chain
MDVEVPSFRRDVTMEDDLVEEIIRVWGYDKIPSTLPGGAISLVSQPESFRQAQVARRALVGAGLSEAVTYSFGDPGRAHVLRSGGEPGPITLLNPLSQDASILRQHPLEGLLGAVATNLRRQQASVRLFEVAPTYEAHKSGTREPRWISIALAGAHGAPSWYGSRDPVDLYDAKGVAELALQAFGVEARTGTGQLPGFEPDAHAALVAPDGTIVAEFGEVAVAVREGFGIEVPVFGAIVSLDAIAAVPVPPRRYRPLPRFPLVQRDLAFLIDDPRLSAGEVEGAIREAGGPLLRAVGVFDVFRFSEGRRSLAWRLTFQAEDRTLTDDEVNQIQERIARHVTGRFRITLRGQA